MFSRLSREERFGNTPFVIHKNHNTAYVNCFSIGILIYLFMDGIHVRLYRDEFRKQL
mgnify:CR=1 FL=1